MRVRETALLCSLLLLAAAGCEDERKLRVVGPGGGAQGGGPIDGTGGAGGAENEAPVGVCGDGLLQEGERCDGAELGGASCASLGFRGGTLRCSDDCALVTSDCIGGEICDNGVDDDGDGAIDCADEECRFIAACVVPENCDEPGDEDGDGLADCADPDCAGTIGCPRCGNGRLDPGETCEPGAIPACVELGYASGTAACDPACLVDASGCRHDGCGDGVVDSPAERCDDGNDVGGDGCSPHCHIEGDVCEAPAALAWDARAEVWSWEGDLTAFHPDYGTQCTRSTQATDGVASFTAPEAGTYYARVEAAFDTVVALWTGLCGYAEDRCADTASGGAAETIEFPLDAGASIHLLVAESRVRGHGGAPLGPFRLEVGRVICGDGVLQGWEECDDGNTAAGDGCGPRCRRDPPSCPDAFDLNAGGDPGTHWPDWFARPPGSRLWIGSTSGSDDDFSTACRPTRGNDAVARFVAPAEGPYDFFLYSTFDAVLSIHSDLCGPTPGEEIACAGKHFVGHRQHGYWSGYVFEDARHRGLWLRQGEVVYLAVDGVGPAGLEPSDFWLLAYGRHEHCGNGVFDPHEECDDGNGIDGDGCDRSCRREPRAPFIHGPKPDAPDWPDYGSWPFIVPTLPLGVSLEGLLEGGGLRGPLVYLLDAAAGTSYLIETSDLLGPDSLLHESFEVGLDSLVPDTYLRLYDGTGAVVAENDDAAAGTPTSRLVWTAPATGTYLLEIGQSSSSWPVHFGPYQLFVPWAVPEYFVLRGDSLP